MENTWNNDAVGDWLVTRNCLQMIPKKQWPPNSPNLNSLQISFLESDARSLLGRFIRSQIQFLTWKSHWRNHRKIFHRTKLSRDLERGWESTCRLVEDILSEQVFTLLFIAPDPTQLNLVADILKMFRTWRLTKDWPEMSWDESDRKSVHSAPGSVATSGHSKAERGGTEFQRLSFWAIWVPSPSAGEPLLHIK